MMTHHSKVSKIPEYLADTEENALLEKANGKVSLFSFGGPLSFGAAADLGHHVREKLLGELAASDHGIGLALAHLRMTKREFLQSF